MNQGQSGGDLWGEGGGEYGVGLGSFLLVGSGEVWMAWVEGMNESVGCSEKRLWWLIAALW